MPLSRLRLRLAGWFALAFLAGLLGLSLSLYLYTHRQNDRRFDRQLAADAGELRDAIRLEHAEAPTRGVAGAVAAALDEWPARPEAFAVYDTAGARLGSTGPAALARALPAALPARFVTPVDRPTGGEHGIRLVAVESAAPAFRVVVASSTAPTDEDTAALALWLAVSTPLTVLVSLVAGYLLSRRALRPVGRLEEAIAGIAPSALDRRLPVRTPPDELDRLAAQFNALLARLEASQTRNRRFLEESAHQIRTPLTLVLGETELALGRAPSGPGPADRAGDGAGDGDREALRRIAVAAAQMRRRVEELWLLARAEAGERPPLVETVELDGLALESADLMRARAQSLGCRLALPRVEPVAVRGSEPLLREAILELLENACRHGAPREPVALSVYVDTGLGSQGTTASDAAAPEAVVEVRNAVDAADAADPTTDDGAARGQGLGVQVVRWIAAEHGGRLQQQREGDIVLTALRLPLGRPTADQWQRAEPRSVNRPSPAGMNSQA